MQMPTRVVAAAVALFLHGAMFLYGGAAFISLGGRGTSIGAALFVWGGLDIFLGTFLLKGHRWARITALTLSVIALAPAVFMIGRGSLGFGAVFPVVVIGCLVGGDLARWFEEMDRRRTGRG